MIILPDLSRKLIHIILLLLISLGPYAQEYRLSLYPAEGEAIRGLVPATHIVGDSLQVYRVLKQSLEQLRDMGFMAASADSLKFDSLDAKAWIWMGQRFSWGKLSFSYVAPEAIRNARIRPARFEGEFVKIGRLQAARSRLLGYYENRGHPFASVWIDSMNISAEHISGQLRVEPGDLFLFDSLLVKGEVKIHPSYMQKLTGIVPGEPYNEEEIRRISSRIGEAVFLEEIRPPELEFYEGGVDVYTYLKRSRSNRFNGILGMLPAHEKTGKLQLTGDVNLLLMNSLGRGETLYFGWKSLEPRSQDLEIQLAWPYLFKTNAGIAFNFDLHKQDTTYLILNPVLDLRFSLGGGSYLNAFIDHFSSSVISVSGLDNVVVLPPYADVSGSLYGLGIQYSQLDYQLNPSRGWDINARLGIGSRKIRKNPSIGEAAYDGLDLSTTKTRATVNLSRYQPLGGRFVLHIKGHAGLLRNEHLFENELFRLGGIGSLRGVDENSLYASAFSLGTLETKYLFEQGSAFFLFLDGGYYEKALPGDFTADFPMGFGAGIQLRTGAGIFLLNYGLGKRFDNPINIGEAKIHIGYLNHF